MRRTLVFVISMAVAVPMASPVIAADEPAAEAPPSTARFSASQLEQLVAPIALYPDSLAMQVLMASTYPLEVVEAERWRAKNPKLAGAELDNALEGQNWDPSVESLTHFPELLTRMSDNLDWTKDLGDAFLDQKDEVLDTIQGMRAKAYEAGTLKTTKEQTVVREVVKEKEVIKVVPADPQVVYVPTYVPTAVYGPTWVAPAPYYPAMYAYPPGYVATTSLLSFGAGMAVGAAISGGCDWDSHDVNVYHHNGGGGGGGGSNNNANINIDNSKTINASGDRTKVEGNRQKWKHNPEHRGGVRYRDQSTAKKYEGGDRVAARERADSNVARGYDRGQGATGRPSQQPSGRPANGRSSPSTRPAQAPAQGGRKPQAPTSRSAGAPSPTKTASRDNALSGYEKGSAAREASTRGAASRGGKSYAGASGGGTRSGSSASASRGGGKGRSLWLAPRLLAGAATG